MKYVREVPKPVWTGWHRDNVIFTNSQIKARGLQFREYICSKESVANPPHSQEHGARFAKLQLDKIPNLLIIAT